MKIKQNVAVPALLLLILFGCSANNGTNPSSQSADNDNHVEFTKFDKTASDDFIDQDAANEAKKVLSKFEDIKAIKAVNTKKYLLVAVQVHHNKRFQLDDLEKKYSKALKKKFPKYQTKLSTDQKLWVELNELEQAINDNKISNNKLEKQVKHMIKLSKEQT
ncbi:hypothetical protein ABRT01_10515 [Lentibacillus sp. L22]|uniref:hypothetical protein n=1 Tax=Lentibacillus sp. L22 TaxID=3163028 RepID=UPI003466055D